MHAVDVKLQFEQRNIAELRALLQKSSDLTCNMIGILDSFDGRLERLEKNITPVYKQTGFLQKRQENIQNILKKMDNVIPMYNLAGRLRDTVERGPSSDVKEYIRVLEELKSAKKYFSDNKSMSTETTALETLARQGENHLLQHFEDLLNSNSRALPALTILDLIEIDEELRSLDSTRSLDQIPKEAQSTLREIAAYLCLCGDESLVFEKYGAVRSRILLQSMQNLKDHEKAASGNSTHMMTFGVSSSPLPSRRSGVASLISTAKESGAGGRSVGRKIRNTFLRTAGWKKGSVDTPTGRYLTVGREIREDVEVESFLTSISALLKLMQSEAALIETILPERQLPAVLSQTEASNSSTKDRAVFEHVVQAAVSSVMSEGELLDKVVKESANRHEFQIVLSLFPALQHLMQLRSEYDFLMRGCVQKDLLCQTNVRMQATLNKSLNEFVESVRNDPVVKMPKDGTVHELTSNVMMMLERLLTFVDMVGDVLAVPDTSILSEAKDKNRCVLSQYVHLVLSALSLNINNKALCYTDECLQAIFRLNNLHYVYHSLQRSGLLDVVQIFYPSLGEHYLENLREEKRKYSQSWSYVLHFIVDVDRSLTITSPRGPTDSLRMKEKDRQVIKDKFAGFNKAMEEILKAQKQYAVPDAELRQTLKRDNGEFIVPKYRLFFDTYSEVPFTKNRDKYVKHSPIDVSNMINQFFDTSA